MNLYRNMVLALVSAALFNCCKTPALVKAPEIQKIPETYGATADTTKVGIINWKLFFDDPFLIKLIDTALNRNQELGITLQEIEIARNEVRMRKGRLLPSAETGASLGMEKVGLYTSQGAGDASTDITPGKEVPEWLPDYRLGIIAHWEADIWKKLRNAKQAALDRYLSTVEGRKFVITSLIAEIASGYYELRALDNQLKIITQNIGIQQHALDVVRVQKQAASATELAVKKFEAEVLNSRTLEYSVRQQIKQTENEISLLTGKYPGTIERDTTSFIVSNPKQIQAGIPSALLENRPDIRQAELELAASKLDLQVARAEFFPSLNITAGVGLQAFNPTYLVKLPESVLFSLAADLAGPLINKTAIKAEYANANARQIQAVFNYERAVLNGFIEVSTEMSNLSKLTQAYELKKNQVDTLAASVEIANELFRSARADYLEVLLTQRDALNARMEMLETKLSQFKAVIALYRSLGGGWQ